MDTIPPTSRLLFRGKQHEVPAGMTVRDAIRRLGLPPEAILATRNGELITDDVILRPGEEIRLVAVISGG
ncbi:MAG: MoaD/ThiS family protein [Anaerolineales bacterium]